MTEIKRKQLKFTKMVALLILYAYELDYGLSFGDAYRYPNCPYGRKASLHKRRLAIDLNLFIDGVYQRNYDAYIPLGLFWESIGGTWGGRWRDANHFSLAHGGRK